MTIEMVSLLGMLGCLAALLVTAILALRADDEPPFFVYCVGMVLVLAALVLGTKAGV